MRTLLAIAIIVTSIAGAHAESTPIVPKPIKPMVIGPDGTSVQQEFLPHPKPSFPIRIKRLKWPHERSA